jgi:hypothetical protein
LHSRGRIQNVGGLAHQLRGLHLGLGGNHLALAQSFLFGHGTERFKNFTGQLQVLQQDGIHDHAPGFGGLGNNALNFMRNRV